jgi:hypothetical protein
MTRSAASPLEPKTLKEVEKEHVLRVLEKH